MWKIEFLVSDKNLADVLRGLAGRVQEMKPPLPVINAVTTKNGVAAAGDGSVATLFYDYLRKRKQTETNTREARDFLKSIGRSPNSNVYLLQQSLKAGLLKRTGKGNATKYHIVKG